MVVACVIQPPKSGFTRRKTTLRPWRIVVKSGIKSCQALQKKWPPSSRRLLPLFETPIFNLLYLQQASEYGGVNYVSSAFHFQRLLLLCNFMAVLFSCSEPPSI